VRTEDLSYSGETILFGNSLNLHSH